MKTYNQIRDDIAFLYAKADKAFRREHPTGSTVFYWQGDNEIQATVIEFQSYMRQDSRVKIRGKSGKEYWIYANRIEESQ